jgi:hypothetical protein
VLNKLFLASMGLALAAITGCVPCSNEVNEHGLAPRPQYDAQIDACITMKSCVPLCRQVFGLDGSVEVRSCNIDNVDPANAHVVVRYYDANSCSDGGDDIGYDDGSYDGGDDGGYDGGSSDGSDDGSTSGDDGSDDGSTTGDDGGDDGSTGDDGGDDGGDTGDDGGGDDGGGDDGGDGGWKVGHHHVHVEKANAPTTSQSRK